MTANESYIRNIYLLASTPKQSHDRVLIVETDLDISNSEQLLGDTQVEDLLIEIHALSLYNPALFGTVDTIEIRGAGHSMNFNKASHYLQEFRSLMPGDKESFETTPHRSKSRQSGPTLS
jgi:hypothetical protein